MPYSYSKREFPQICVGLVQVDKTLKMLARANIPGAVADIPEDLQHLIADWLVAQMGHIPSLPIPKDINTLLGVLKSKSPSFNSLLKRIRADFSNPKSRVAKEYNKFKMSNLWAAVHVGYNKLWPEEPELN